MVYLALLRGINVGGKSLVKMDALRQALTDDGLHNVRTYIQSGNVLFTSDQKDTAKLAAQISAIVKKHFGVDAIVAVFSEPEWRAIIKAAPKSWGQDKTWKHNIFVMIKPYDMAGTLAVFGKLKPDIESIQAGDGVIYQSNSIREAGKTSTTNIVGTKHYKQMTIRNYNTAVKLLALMDMLP